MSTLFVLFEPFGNMRLTLSGHVSTLQAFIFQLLYTISMCRHFKIMCRLLIISLYRLGHLFTCVDTSILDLILSSYVDTFNSRINSLDTVFMCQHFQVMCQHLQFLITYCPHVSTLQPDVSTLLFFDFSLSAYIDSSTQCVDTSIYDLSIGLMCQLLKRKCRLLNHLWVSCVNTTCPEHTSLFS